MLSIRNMLTESTPITKGAELDHHRPSALDISFLLCPSDNTKSELNDTHQHHFWTGINYHEEISNDHCFRKSNLKQHQEKRLVEQEFFHRRRQSISSSSSSSSCSSPVSSYEKYLSTTPIKAKRRRASTKQLDVLNKVFEKTFFPSTQLRAELGRQLGMSPRTVQIWFQNRRQAIRTKERTISSRESSVPSVL
ncbi:Homeodomain-like protein [Blakeslea trispora]|nr:Homeodomain-like protein [Blakeslea trispora]